MGMADGKRASLTANDWTMAALDALARGGLAAVAVEPLAKALGTTKGSFYWHFADRNALIEAALERWEQRDTDRVIAATEQAPDAADRLRDLLRLVFTAVQGDSGASAGSVELALQANATHPLVASTLARVTERRLAYLNSLFSALGLPAGRARDRSLLAYAAFLGHAQLAHSTPELMPVGRALTIHVDQVIETLTKVDG
jgi:AcrR family transcriptional regulator